MKVKNLQKTGAALAAMAASAFLVSNLTGCANPEIVPQQSTPVTTQMKHSCKGAMPSDTAAPRGHKQNSCKAGKCKGMKCKGISKHSCKSAASKAASRARGNSCAGVAGQ